MSYKYLTNKFTTGELDPKLLAAVDFDAYRKGARRLRQVICTPQGSAQRRFGSLFETIISDTGQNITDENKVRIIPFEYLDNEKYWLIMRTDMAAGVEIDVYLDDVFQVTVPIGAYLDTDIPNIRWVNDVNKVYLLHENYMPRIFQRTSAAVWTDSIMVLSFYPAEDFSVFDNPTNNYTNNGTTFTPNLVAATTVTASTAVFTSNHSGIGGNVGGAIIFNGGVFHITSVNAAGTVATGYTTDDFTTTAATLGSLVFLGERAWGDGSVVGAAPAGIARGFPRHGQFFQSRLVLGGAVVSPGTAYASEVKEFFNFNNTNTDASTGWGVEAGVTGTDTINDIMSSKSLVLLTTKGSSATNILTDLPTTPTNVFLNTQGKEGSRNMDGVILDNQILYADRAGNTIWSMTYDVPDSGYSVSSASILSSHLIRNPRWADVFDPDNVDGRYYLLVNADGTMAIYNTIASENIHAWTLASTVGRYIDVACLSEQAKTLVKRQVGTGPVVNGALQAYYSVDDTFSVFRNQTTAINAATNTVVLSIDEYYILFGNEIPFTTISFNLPTPSAQDLGLTYEYLDQDGVWNILDTVDFTNGLTNVGTIEWDITAATNWGRIPIIGTTQTYMEYPNYYWMRIRRNNPAVLADTISNGIYINTESIITLERLTFDVYMDSQITVVADGTGLVTGLQHLAGQYAFVFIGNFPFGTAYVSDVGQLETDFPGSDVTVGLDYQPNITLMPLFAFLNDGYHVYEPANIKRMYVDVYNSLGVTAQGVTIQPTVPGNFMTVDAILPLSDFYTVPTYAGWDPRVEMTISQSYPAPMVLRAVCLVVEVT